ncbi:hypothetical protein FKM82_021219 [Ascaphus truei]
MSFRSMSAVHGVALGRRLLACAGILYSPCFGIRRKQVKIFFLKKPLNLHSDLAPLFHMKARITVEIMTIPIKTIYAISVHLNSENEDASPS